MADTSQNRYVPDYRVTPGEMLAEYLETFGMTQAELAIRTGLAKKTINEIIRGKSPITPETALKLALPWPRPTSGTTWKGSSGRTACAWPRRVACNPAWAG